MTASMKYYDQSNCSIYNKLITLLMVDGKFQTAKKIVDQSINNLNQHLNDSTESQLILLRLGVVLDSNSGILSKLIPIFKLYLGFWIAISLKKIWLILKSKCCPVWIIICFISLYFLIALHIADILINCGLDPTTVMIFIQYVFLFHLSL